MLRQLESILSIHKLARLGNYVDALREIAKLPFLPLDPRGPDIAVDVFENLSPHVQACIPDLLKAALTCLDNVTDSDGSLRALRTKVLSCSGSCCLVGLYPCFIYFFSFPFFNTIIHFIVFPKSCVRSIHRTNELSIWYGKIYGKIENTTHILKLSWELVLIC